MIVSWDPFLMKILLKKEVCTSHKQCTGSTREREREREREKKRERQMQMHEHGTQSKRSLNHKNYFNYFLRKK